MNWFQWRWKLALMQKINFGTTENRETQENYFFASSNQIKFKFKFQIQSENSLTWL